MLPLLSRIVSHPPHAIELESHQLYLIEIDVYVLEIESKFEVQQVERGYQIFPKGTRAQCDFELLSDCPYHIDAFAILFLLLFNLSLKNTFGRKTKRIVPVELYVQIFLKDDLLLLLVTMYKFWSTGFIFAGSVTLKIFETAQLHGVEIGVIALHLFYMFELDLEQFLQG